MRCIENHPQRNSLLSAAAVGGGGISTRPLIQKIESLKRELMIRDSVYISGLTPLRAQHSGGVLSSELTRAQQARTVQLACRYALSSDAELEDSEFHGIEIRSLMQVDCIASTLRKALWEACNKDISKVSDIIQKISGNSKSAIDSIEKAPIRELPDNEGVEKLEVKNNIVTNNEICAASNIQLAHGNIASQALDIMTNDMDDDDNKNEENTALLFENFISRSGKELHFNHEEIKVNIKQAKNRLRSLIEFVNRQKIIIDEINQQLVEISSNGSDEDSEVKKVEQSNMLKNAKLEYKQGRTELQKCKEQIAEMNILKQRSLDALMKAFKESTAIHEE
jgi:hypothetical protein